MVTTKSTGAVAPFTPEQRRSLVEVVTVLNAYLAGHASIDATLLRVGGFVARGGRVLAHSHASLLH